MKRVSYILVTAAVSFLLTGCGIYNKYEQKSDTPADAFGTDASIQAATSDSTIARMSWREFFTDPLLQELIERVLANNTDLNSARIAVEKSQAALKAAKLAYLPSLAFAPQGTLSSFDNSAAVKTYNLPLQLSMDIDVFGSITNKKRAAKAVLLQAQMQEEAVRSNLVSITAQQSSCCRCSTANWKFSCRPTVSGTSLSRPNRRFGRTARPIALPSTRWRHPISA